MTYTLGEAAKATGKSKPTLSRAIKKGTISAVKNENGSYTIDPTELHRVYPPLPSTSNDTVSVKPSATPNDNSALQREVELLREMLDETKTDRDQWREQAQKITAMIEDKREKRGLWARLVG